MVRAVDQETIAIEIMVFYLEFPRARDIPVLGEPQGQSEGRGRGANCGLELCCGFCRKKNGQGRASELRVGCLNSFGGLLDRGTVLSCLLLDPGMIRAGG